MPRKPTRKILTLKKLLRLRARWKRSGRTVVFTNGVFDILHPGHIRILEKARSFGDVLVVGVNSDASARRLGKKGPRRPVNRLSDRMCVLAALGCVDAVVAFREDTPEKLLAGLRPDVLVKGADYKPGQVAGRKHVRRVVLVRLKKGYSTTRLLQRLRLNGKRGR